MGNLVLCEFKVGNVKKKDFGIESRHVYMYLLDSSQVAGGRLRP